MTTARTIELRTYVCFPGRLPALHQRIQDYNFEIWSRLGLDPIGFFTPTEGDRAADTLIYLIASDSPEAAKIAWEKFDADPEWIEARALTELDGPIVDTVDSIFMEPTAFSAVK
jgi:NIPSNAP